MSQANDKPPECRPPHIRIFSLRSHLLLENKSLLAVSLAMGAMSAGIGAIGTVRVLYAQSRGASLVIIAAMTSAYIVSNFIFQYPSSWLTDRWGRKQIMLVGLATDVIISAIYLVVTDPLIFTILRFIEGITAAMLGPAARAFVVDSVLEEQQGKAFGTFAAFSNGGYLLGPAIGGLLATTGYTIAFIGAIVFRIIAFVLVLTLVHNVAQRDIHLVKVYASGSSYKALFVLPLLAVYIIAFGDAVYEGFDLTLMPLWMHDHLGASIFTIGLAYMVWAIPNIILSPVGGLLADRLKRYLLILIFGLAQVPFYVMYGLLNTATFIIVLFVLHSCLNTLMRPAVDSYLAVASPGNMRAQAQAIYGTTALIGSFAGAGALTPLYSVNFRLPLFAIGFVYGICVLSAGIMMYVLELHLKREIFK